MNTETEIIIAVIIAINTTAFCVIMSSVIYLRARVTHVINILHRIEDKIDENHQ